MTTATISARLNQTALVETLKDGSAHSGAFLDESSHDLSLHSTFMPVSMKKCIQHHQFVEREWVTLLLGFTSTMNAFIFSINAVITFARGHKEG